MGDGFYNLMSIFAVAVVFAFAFTAAERVFGGFGRTRKRRVK